MSHRQAEPTTGFFATFALPRHWPIPQKSICSASNSANSRRAQTDRLSTLQSLLRKEQLSLWSRRENGCQRSLEGHAFPNSESGMKLVQDSHWVGKFSLVEFQATRFSSRFRRYRSTFSFTCKSTEIDLRRSKGRRAQLCLNMQIRQIRVPQPHICAWSSSWKITRLNILKKKAFERRHACNLSFALQRFMAWSLLLAPRFGAQEQSFERWGSVTDSIGSEDMRRELQQHQTAQLEAFVDCFSENRRPEQEQTGWWDLPDFGSRDLKTSDSFLSKGECSRLRTRWVFAPKKW